MPYTKKQCKYFAANPKKSRSVDWKKYCFTKPVNRLVKAKKSRR